MLAAWTVLSIDYHIELDSVERRAVTYGLCLLGACGLSVIGEAGHTRQKSVSR